MFFKIIIMKITGMVKIKVEGFFIERFLNLCKNENIIFKSLEKKDSSFITFEIMKSDFRKLKVIARKTGCKVKIENKTGLPFFVNKYKKRKVFAVAVITIAPVTLEIVTLFPLTTPLWVAPPIVTVILSIS